MNKRLHFRNCGLHENRKFSSLTCRIYSMRHVARRVLVLYIYERCGNIEAIAGDYVLLVFSQRHWPLEIWLMPPEVCHPFSPVKSRRLWGKAWTCNNPQIHFCDSRNLYVNPKLSNATWNSPVIIRRPQAHKTLYHLCYVGIYHGFNYGIPKLALHVANIYVSNM